MAGRASAKEAVLRAPVYSYDARASDDDRTSALGFSRVAVRMQETDQVEDKRLRLRRSLRESGWRDGFRGEPRDHSSLQEAENGEVLIRAAGLLTRRGTRHL
ncbi:hypothetical protein MRX96_001871 [Rhipicephalus microplus]